MPRPCRIRKQLNEFLFFFILVITIQQNFLEMCRSFLQLMKFHWILGYTGILLLIGWQKQFIFTCFWSCKKWSAKIPDTGEKSIAFFYWKSVTIETFFSFSTEYFFLNALKTTAVVIGTYYIPNYMQIFFKGTAVNVVLFCTQKVIGAQLPPLFKQCFSWIK